MSNEYQNNHYVPVWYQKRFIPKGQKDNELFYLDLNPATFTDPRGVTHKIKNPKKLGPKRCFSEDDLYTTQFGQERSTDIEKIFFGKIDGDGRKAVDYYANFSYPWDGNDHFNELMMYMSTQKLRTPKAFEWLSKKAKTSDKNQILQLMLKLRQLHCAIWTECVWLIADASQSNTKFIVTDHPVTVYNRACGPRFCIRNGDPDIWLNGTHTIFPLSLDKILILTNLSWVRNPYQSEKSLRPNPNPFRGSILKITDIQTLRHLSEEEVRQINFILKSMAKKYIAAADKEWLYPEKYVSKSDWNKYGHGYLFMPDPRPLHLGGQMFWGGGSSMGGAMDEYGRPPWHSEFNKESNSNEERDTFYHFQGEFARLFGPYRRGRACNVMKLDNEKDSDDFHQYHISLENSHKSFKSRKKKPKGRR